MSHESEQFREEERTFINKNWSNNYAFKQLGKKRFVHSG